MAYSYGTQGAPAVGGGAPGLPSRKQAEQSTYTRIVSGSGVLIPPQGAKFMRVAVIGGGGGASRFASDNNVRGGAGGGCAASKIVPATAITYSIGSGGLASTGTAGDPGGDTTAIFSTYFLIGQGGQSPTSLTSAIGGIGIGGDYNFSGGHGVRAGSTTYYAAGGGGAAGPNGNGGHGASVAGTAAGGAAGTSGTYEGTGWGPGGGAGGAYSINTSTDASGCGGGGTSAGTNGAQSSYGTAPDFFPVNTTTQPWGVAALFASQLTGLGSYGTPGGEMGGGGGIGRFSTQSDAANGGSGGMVVEWFY